MNQFLLSDTGCFPQKKSRQSRASKDSVRSSAFSNFDLIQRQSVQVMRKAYVYCTRNTQISFVSNKRFLSALNVPSLVFIKGIHSLPSKNYRPNESIGSIKQLILWKKQRLWTKAKNQSKSRKISIDLFSKRKKLFFFKLIMPIPA